MRLSVRAGENVELCAVCSGAYGMSGVLIPTRSSTSRKTRMGAVDMMWRIRLAGETLEDTAWRQVEKNCGCWCGLTEDEEGHTEFE